MSEYWLAVVIAPAPGMTAVNRRAGASVTTAALQPPLTAPLACELDAFGTAGNGDVNAPPGSCWFRFRLSSQVFLVRSDVVTFISASTPEAPGDLPGRVAALESDVKMLKQEVSQGG